MSIVQATLAVNYCYASLPIGGLVFFIDCVDVNTRPWDSVYRRMSGADMPAMPEMFSGAK
ncbi:MAG: hypothetical protein EBY25_08015 [Betaproteobacteria bacterium]|nr:hypothetical protein [Betaproteobacteria bacterium]